MLPKHNAFGLFDECQVMQYLYRNSMVGKSMDSLLTSSGLGSCGLDPFALKNAVSWKLIEDLDASGKCSGRMIVEPSMVEPEW
jgi:hypothetical protein